MTQQTKTRIELDYARNSQAGNNRAYVVSVVILAAILALMVVLVAGSAKAAPCNPERNPDCQPVDPPEDPNPDPPDPSYHPVPGGFSWSMESRYPGPLFASVKDFSKDSYWHQEAFVQAQSGFKVFFNGCASDQDRRAPSGSTNFIYSWSFQASEGSLTTKEGRTCRMVQHTFMQEGSYEVKLTIKDAAGATLGTFPQIVTVKDKLIVAIGDSYGSGEGNPDRPQIYDSWGFVTAGPQWADKRCHRSATAGSAQAARDLEFTDPHSSVTFVFLACSGAGIESGILGEYPGREYAEPWLKPQLDEVDRLVGNRQIDALVMSAGGNDAGFGYLIEKCANPLNSSCTNQGSVISERLARLPELYKDLNDRIIDNPEIMNDPELNVAKNNVYLTEYPIGTRGSANDGYCGSYDGDPLLFNIRSEEAAYITENMAWPLNQKMQEAAQAYGWAYVGGIDEQFSRWGEDSHGYCSGTSWMRTMVESNRLQGPESHKNDAWFNVGLWGPPGGTTGTMHPNTIGQDVYKTRIQSAIGVPSPGPTFAASEPEYAPGRVVVRVTATDPSGIVSESVSVNATGACQVEGITCTTRRPDGQSLEWTLEVTKEGLHTFDFRATDGDGQESSFVHEVEFLPPAPPIINGPTDNSYDTDGSLTFFGTAEAGSKISLFEEGKQEPVGSAATADGSGAWSLTLSGVGNGPHTYTAKATTNSSGLTSVASEPVRVIVDTQAPKVSSTTPPANATGIAPGVNVSATFSEAMMGSSLNPTTFKLMKAGTTTAISAMMTYENTANRAILNPNSNLRPGTKYKAVVTTGAKDLAGNRLDQDQDPSNGLQQKSWTFTIRN